MQAIKQATENFKEKKYRINYIINKIEEDLNGINKYYTDKDTFLIFKYVKKEAITDENLELLYKTGKIDEFIRTLEVCENMLVDLYSKLATVSNEKDNTKSSLDNIEYDYNRYKWHDKPKYFKSVKREITKAVSLLLSIGILTVGAHFSKSTYNSFTMAPKVTEYYYDSEGGKDIKVSHKTDSSEYIRICEYLDTDKAGYRIRKAYDLNPSLQLLSDANDLLDIDLSSITPSEEGLYHDEDINNVSKGYCRTYEAVKIDDSDMAKADNLETGYKAVAIELSVLVMLMVIGLTYAVQMLFNGINSDSCTEYIKYIYELIKYRNKLSYYRKRMKEDNEEIQNYCAILDDVFRKIDKTIEMICSKLSTETNIKIYPSEIYNMDLFYLILQ